jgi:hypothetical protein
LTRRTWWPTSVVLFAEVGDIGAGGFEDPKAQQAGHGQQREVVPVRRFPGGGEQRLELQAGEPEGGRFGGDCGAADVLGGCQRMMSPGGRQCQAGVTAGS